MKRNRVVALLPLALLAACTHRVPTATIELIDTSLSISPQAEKFVLHAVPGQIDGLERGDTLVLIPITGNAENDAGGHILRLQAPTKRESYDADLRRFRVSAKKQFAAWAAGLGADPCRTDILGSLDAARQEIASAPKGSIRRLVVVSDFLEDDDQHHFVSDRALAKPPTARDLALRLRAEHGFTSRGAVACLGRLQSLQFESLSPARREAIRAFWSTYFAEQGGAPGIQLDGVGMLAGSDRACLPGAASKVSEAKR